MAMLWSRFGKAAVVKVNVAGLVGGTRSRTDPFDLKPVSARGFRLTTFNTLPLAASVTVTPEGLGPTPAIVRITTSAWVSTTETSSEEELATNSLSPSGVSAQPSGSVPTLMVLTTRRVSASITESVPLRWLVTYTFRLSGVMATRCGSAPTAISATLRLTSPPTLSTETEPLSGFTAQRKRSSLLMATGLDEVGRPSCGSSSPPAARPKPTTATVRHRETIAQLQLFIIVPRSEEHTSE